MELACDFAALTPHIHHVKTRQSIGCITAGVCFNFWILQVALHYWRDPHSAFFDDRHVYDLKYSLFREHEAFQHISIGFQCSSSNPDKYFGVSEPCYVPRVCGRKERTSELLRRIYRVSPQWTWWRGASCVLCQCTFCEYKPKTSSQLGPAMDAPTIGLGILLQHIWWRFQDASVTRGKPQLLWEGRIAMKKTNLWVVITLIS